MGFRQAIISTNAGLFLSEALGTHFSESAIKINIFSWKKCISKSLMQYVGHFVSTSMS